MSERLERADDLLDVVAPARLHLDDDFHLTQGDVGERPAATQQLSFERIKDSPLLNDSLRAEITQLLETRDRYLQGLSGLRLHPPGVSFQGDTTLWLGGREVRLIHPGPAHTQGDVVVYLPDGGILAAGDLLEQGLSIVSDASTPTGWAAELAELDVERLLPAHGPLQDRRLLDRQANLFSTVVREVRAARAAGLTLEESWDRVEAAAAAVLRGADGRMPVRSAIFFNWLEAALPRAWYEAPEG